MDIARASRTCMDKEFKDQCTCLFYGILIFTHKSALNWLLSDRYVGRKETLVLRLELLARRHCPQTNWLAQAVARGHIRKNCWMSESEYFMRQWPTSDRLVSELNRTSSSPFGLWLPLSHHQHHITCTSFRRFVSVVWVMTLQAVGVKIVSRAEISSMM